MLKFRLITPEDFLLILNWLSKEHVKQWWDDGDDTLEKVSIHYGSESVNVRRFILTEENGENGREEKPIGYFQYYFTDDGAIGIDQFIGEESYIRRGIGVDAIKQFIELINNKHNPAYIKLDTSPENRGAIRCYEKVGFKYYELVKNQDGKLAYVMKLDKSKGT